MVDVNTNNNQGGVDISGILASITPLITQFLTMYLMIEIIKVLMESFRA